MNILTYAAVILVMLLSLTKAVAETVGPHKVINQATINVIEELQQLSEEERTEIELERLVTEHILPVVNEELFAQKILGRHWTHASDEQRTAFVLAFRNRQIETFKGAFQAFNGESLIFSDPVIRNNKAIINAEFKQTNGQPNIPVSFKMHLHEESAQWLVHDLVVAGLSMGKTFRSEYSQRLRSKDLNALILELSAVE